MRPSRLAVALAAILAAGLTLPAVAAPGKDGEQRPKHGNERDHDKRGHDKHHGPKDIPARDGCVGDPSSVILLSYPSGGGTAEALYALPSHRPRGIVVFDHGYGHTMYSWARHIQRTAQQLGVIAIAPDYRGQVNNLATQPLPSSRGWRVSAGAVDTNTVAQLFDSTCMKGRGHNVLYGVSMGGNTSGLALAAKPKRTGNKPLWDEWVNVEGAANVLETYLGARALAPVNAFAKNAQEDIEQEMGGPPETAMQTYLDRSVVNRVDDIKASGVKGVVMVHGYADGLVTHDISRQLQLRLRAVGVPVDFTSFVTHSAGSEPGTTLDGYLPTGQTSPFAGHASETSETHDVGRAGFRKLAELYHGMRHRCGERVVDGMTGQSQYVQGTC